MIGRTRAKKKNSMPQERQQMNGGLWVSPQLYSASQRVPHYTEDIMHLIQDASGDIQPLKLKTEAACIKKEPLMA